jgi:hypothetical protein
MPFQNTTNEAQTKSDLQTVTKPTAELVTVELLTEAFVHSGRIWSALPGIRQAEPCSSVACQNLLQSNVTGVLPALPERAGKSRQWGQVLPLKQDVSNQDQKSASGKGPGFFEDANELGAQVHASDPDFDKHSPESVARQRLGQLCFHSGRGGNWRGRMLLKL